MAQPQVTELYPRWSCPAKFIRLLLMYAGASEEEEDEQGELPCCGLSGHGHRQVLQTLLAHEEEANQPHAF